MLLNIAGTLATLFIGVSLLGFSEMVRYTIKTEMVIVLLMVVIILSIWI